MSEPILQQEQLPILTSSAVKESLAPQDRPSTHSPPSQSAHNSDSDHTHLDSEDESLLETSTTGNEVAQLLRKTVEELELALEDSRKLLSERDKELAKVRGELERYRQQAAREIANKTKLAQSLDESHSHAQQLEELLQQWQLELRESKIQKERIEISLQQERARCEHLEEQLSASLVEKDKELEQIKSQLVNIQQKLKQREESSSRNMDLAEGSNPGVDRMDKMQLHFLKQAIYHLLTDFHAEDQLRAIMSILDFMPQERKAVYAKVEEKKRSSRGLYM